MASHASENLFVESDGSWAEWPKNSHARFPRNRQRALALWRIWAHAWTNRRDAESFDSRAPRANAAIDIFRCFTIWSEDSVAK